MIMNQNPYDLNNVRCYENYPRWISVISNLFQLSIYTIGVLIIFRSGFIPVLFYLAFILILEYRLLRKSCIYCYYYGKRCFSGKGKLAALLFKQGDPRLFSKKQIKYLDLLPDLLVSLVPFGLGMILLLIQFEWLLTIFMILLVILTFSGTSFVRGSLACKYCKQRLIGCPAEQLFSKTSTKAS